MERRDFLKIAGAATVATALPGCTPKEPKSLIPYIIPDEEIIPGRSVAYATVCRECPAGCGMHVRVREGRATKAEGNPRHPVNRGALCARGQASLQGLYNPDRLQTPLRKNDKGEWDRLTWEEAEELIIERLQELKGKGEGRKVAWMSQHVTGSLDRLINDWLKGTGQAERYRYEPFNHEAISKANELTFGFRGIPRYDLERADTVISFGADFLETWLSPVEFTRQLASMRGGAEGRQGRLIYVGPRMSLTASNADRWLNVPAEAMGPLAMALTRIVLAENASKVDAGEQSRMKAWVEPFTPERVASMAGMDVNELVDLGRSLGSPRAGLALAGGPLLESEHGLRTAVAVNLLNYACGATERGVDFGSPSGLSQLSSYNEILDLTAAMEGGTVSALFLNEVNPVFTLPAGKRFAEGLKRVPFVVSFASFMDETTAHASLVLPMHTPLESWGDFEPYPGVHGLAQPVMQPVFGTKMLGDVLLETGKKLTPGWSSSPASFSEYVKEEWKAVHKKVEGNGPFDTFWTESLARGGAWDEKPAPRKVRLSAGANASLPGLPALPEGGSDTFALLAYPSIAHFDGRGANRPWLQELPDPMTRLTWGTWVEIHPEDASRLGLMDGDAVIMTAPSGEIEAGVVTTKAVRKGTVAVPIGQGHAAFGRYASGVGSNPFLLLDAAAASSGGMRLYGARVQLHKGEPKRLFASVQEARSEHHREIARTIGAEELRSGGHAMEGEAPSVYSYMTYAKHQWGMVIDLDKCTGCSACVTACYAENNIPVVGINEVVNGREMAWLRVDRYYYEEDEDEEISRARFIPMFCQQCGSAPCETVCPVYAAYHTEEGLNGQVYNRCIGTRYCANNCPYKVRRFNWFEHDWPEPLNWQLNPDVTVRSPGVMEKCTFCVQRIVEAKNNARLENRPVRDGEVRTACQQTCPAQAITFGDRKQEQSSVVAAARDSGRGYHVLEELNTRPAVTYLKRITDAKGA